MEKVFGRTVGELLGGELNRRQATSYLKINRKFLSTICNIPSEQIWDRVFTLQSEQSAESFNVINN